MQRLQVRNVAGPPPGAPTEAISYELCLLKNEVIEMKGIMKNILEATQNMKGSLDAMKESLDAAVVKADEGISESVSLRQHLSDTKDAIKANTKAATGAVETDA